MLSAVNHFITLLLCQWTASRAVYISYRTACLEAMAPAAWTSRESDVQKVQTLRPEAVTTLVGPLWRNGLGLLC